jgi:hypothetical protein
MSVGAQPCSDLFLVRNRTSGVLAHGAATGLEGLARAWRNGGVSCTSRDQTNHRMTCGTRPWYGRYIMEERFYAIRVAVGMANAGDVVVIAGKGHEDYVDWTIDQVRRAEARIASQ